MPKNNINYKDFSGKRYSFEKSFKTEAEAKKYALKRRKDGYLARVSSVAFSQGNYAVYTYFKM